MKFPILGSFVLGALTALTLPVILDASKPVEQTPMLAPAQYCEVGVSVHCLTNPTELEKQTLDTCIAYEMNRAIAENFNTCMRDTARKKSTHDNS